jgi:hypothetical protein
MAHLQQVFHLASCTPSIFVTNCKLTLKNALSATFPLAAQLLCVWHLHKCLIKNCQPSFNGSDKDWSTFKTAWNCVMYVPSEEAFDENWAELCCLWTLTEHATCIAYLVTTWYPLRSQWACAWTNAILHFLHMALSQIEGTHSAIKRYILQALTSLECIFSRIASAAKTQQEEIKRLLAQAGTHIDKTLNYTLTCQLLLCVTFPSLDLLSSQLDIISTAATAEKLLPPCTNKFEQTTGIPCSHTISRIIAKGQQLTITNFHKHWHLPCQYVDKCWLHTLSLSNPPLKTKASESNALTAPTGRIYSGHEVIKKEAKEAATAKKQKAPHKPCTCSGCNEVTLHDICKCPLQAMKTLTANQKKKAKVRSYFYCLFFLFSDETFQLLIPA